jgi:hypothetical protein
VGSDDGRSPAEGRRACISVAFLVARSSAQSCLPASVSGMRSEHRCDGGFVGHPMAAILPADNDGEAGPAVGIRAAAWRRLPRILTVAGCDCKGLPRSSVSEFVHKRRDRIGDQIRPLPYHEVTKPRQIDQGHTIRVIALERVAVLWWRDHI